MAESTKEGLSPRGRGNPGRRCRLPPPGRAYGGSIPAWAGEPGQPHHINRLAQVYPRVGGGTPSLWRVVPLHPGLSPRGRGNRYAHARAYRRLRSIPAWAGEPLSTGRRRRASTVYPRVGGGTLAVLADSNTAEGLSPRGRGNHGAALRSGNRQRSIPAWAGEPQGYAARPRTYPVYPRVGGGTALLDLGVRTGGGLSPRGRGNPTRQLYSLAKNRSIPAWAGEPAISPQSTSTARVYPRVGGGTVSVYAYPSGDEGLSPRGRGNHGNYVVPTLVERSIPAWAGEPQKRPS